MKRGENREERNMRRIRRYIKEKHIVLKRVGIEEMAVTSPTVA